MLIFCRASYSFMDSSRSRKHLATISYPFSVGCRPSPDMSWLNGLPMHSRNAERTSTKGSSSDRASFDMATEYSS